MRTSYEVSGSISSVRVNLECQGRSWTINYRWNISKMNYTGSVSNSDSNGLHSQQPLLIQQGQRRTRPGIRWPDFYLSTSATSIQHSGNGLNGWDTVRHQSKALVAPGSGRFQQGSHCHADIKNPNTGRCLLLVTGDEFNAVLTARGHQTI